MKVAINYKDAEDHRPAEKEIARFTAKLSRLLKNYDPDLVQLRGSFSRNPRNGEYIFAATLVLPSDTLHAKGASPHLRTCCKEAFSELEDQVKKHMAHVRKDYQWKRKRPRVSAPAPI
jgi:ribosome-associated translation inhibitor RaiA